MRKNTWKKLTSCLLSVAMLLGVCTTSFAAFPQDEIDYVKGVIEDAKAEIESIIDLAENTTNEQKLDAVKNVLATYDVAPETVDAVIAIIEDEAAEIFEIIENDGVGAIDKVEEYVAIVKAALIAEGVDADVIDAVEVAVRAEIGEIVEIVENEDDEAAKAKIGAYVELLKEALGITVEDEAKFAEIVSDLEAIAAEIESISADDVKAVIDAKIDELKAQAALQVAKLGHKHYEADEDALYVAIAGIDTITGLGLVGEELPYTDLVAEAYGIENVSTDVADIADADLITFQPEASALLDAVLSGDADWSKYLSAEQLAVVETIWAEIAEIAAKDWAAEGADIFAYVASELKAAVLENLPEEIVIDEAKIDDAIAFVAPYVAEALAYAEDKKDLAVDTVNGLDPMVVDYAEKLAFAVVSYVIDTAKTIDEITEINPDATLVVLGMYNIFDGLEIESINVGEYFAYAVEATNLYYSALAAVNGGFAFVNIDETTINGFEGAVDIADIFDIDVNMMADAAGHAYIKDQIVDALTCDYSVYEAIDADTHALKCSICEFVKATEAHEFGDDDICDKCGYEKVVIPEEPTPEEPEEPTPSRPSYSGGGSGVKKEVTLKFKDVNKDAWYYSYIKTLFEKGLMNGISEEEFAPDATLTRGMFVTVLYRIEKEPKVNNEIAFTDVAAGKYYENAVKWAAANGIVLGVSETEFAPETEVTREQMATILARYVDYKKVKVPSKDGVEYTDNAEIAEYAQSAVVVANKLGILIGNDDGSFAPKSDATRAQAAALFARLLNVLK
ncbi:MAG: S-layer homology domain-containing protein [Clostridia bacterium]|nr:S-layer homology domain-containing protein [Clostridia bacterium]